MRPENIKTPDIFLACIFVLHSVNAYSQNNTVDSLQKLLQNAGEDTSKVKILIALGKEFRYSDTNTSLYFSNRALTLANALNYEKGIADSKKRNNCFICQPERGQGEVYNGNGLTNMRARADDIKASLHIHSEINKGTAIQLVVTD